VLGCAVLVLISHSVKDRIAYSMISAAEQQGVISPGKTLLVREAGLYSSC